jgi:transposase, IS30 family
MARHLTIEDRDRIAELKHQGSRQNAIARALQRSPSTICRELKRNSSDGKYLAGQAQQRAERRRRERPLLRKMDDPKIKAAVRKGLKLYWSPEQIDGRLKREASGQRVVSARTIYNWIDSQNDHKTWRKFLRKRGKREFRSRRPGRIGAPIKDRPKVIETRSRLGDFEGDTVLGSSNSGGLGTLVDRKSRYTVITGIKSKHADHVYQRIRKCLNKLDRTHRRSVTFDNGTEFTNCSRLQRYPGVEVYVADPGRPHQRGTNENTNGLIRQFYPKGTPMRRVAPHQIRAVQNLLNNRPRACLNYQTPNEVFLNNPAAQNCN